MNRKEKQIKPPPPKPMRHLMLILKILAVVSVAEFSIFASCVYLLGRYEHLTFLRPYTWQSSRSLPLVMVISPRTP